jgi:DNA primase
MIYTIVFGTDYGQVQCAFHNDTRASAGIGPNGEYHCFTCGAKAHDSVSFIKKYFDTTPARAQKMLSNIERIQTYQFTKLPLDSAQLQFLNNQGITTPIAEKYFFKAGTGKLMYHHTWNGITVGHTWFNSPLLSTYNASEPKYKYSGNNIGGMLTPYDDVIRYQTLILCEGEKDMLTAKSMGFPNAVTKMGGAITPLLAGLNLDNKKIVIIYDCDDAGKEGAYKDAQQLALKHQCEVKVVDLNLPHKEDLNDYFIKYGKTKNDLVKLIVDTPLFIPDTQPVLEHKIKKYVDSLTQEELATLKNILKENT